MDRIKRNFELTTFKRCQLCGYSSNEIVEFSMFYECDDNDNPELDNVIVICNHKNIKNCSGKCMQAIIDHPRLYVDVPWGEGGPGYFMLQCGDCIFRNGTQCKHSDLKANGGNGLEIRF